MHLTVDQATRAVIGGSIPSLSIGVAETSVCAWIHIGEFKDTD